MKSSLQNDRKQIVKILVECRLDIDAILQKLHELELYDYGLSLREVAKVMRLSKTRVKQIESKALKKLRKELEDKDAS